MAHCPAVALPFVLLSISSVPYQPLSHRSLAHCPGVALASVLLSISSVPYESTVSLLSGSVTRCGTGFCPITRQLSALLAHCPTS